LTVEYTFTPYPRDILLRSEIPFPLEPLYPLPLKALVKRGKLISICATIAFTDKGERCPVFVKGLTQFKYILDSAINRPVPLIRLLGYYSRLSPAGISKLCII
jgi:hypothetical protein